MQKKAKKIKRRRRFNLVLLIIMFIIQAITVWGVWNIDNHVYWVAKEMMQIQDHVQSIDEKVDIWQFQKGWEMRFYDRKNIYKL